MSPGSIVDHTAYHTATDLLGALAARRATSVELVEAAISRIEAGDGCLSAVVVRDFERARAAAPACHFEH